MFFLFFSSGCLYVFFVLSGYIGGEDYLARLPMKNYAHCPKELSGGKKNGVLQSVENDCTCKYSYTHKYKYKYKFKYKYKYNYNCEYNCKRKYLIIYISIKVRWLYLFI